MKHKKLALHTASFFVTNEYSTYKKPEGKVNPSGFVVEYESEVSCYPSSYQMSMRYPLSPPQ